MKTLLRLSGLLLILASTALARDAVRLVRSSPGPRPPASSEWKSVVGHTHNMRTGGISFENARRALVEWTGKLGIAAIGVGSPWEPVSRAAYLRYEGRDRDLYYAGKVDPESVMHRPRIAGLFAELNAMADGRTLFFQDNETPKCRLGHAWWFGYRYDVPAWHDYSQDRPIQYWENDEESEINALTGEPHRRRCLLEIMAAQRGAGAVGVLAHPTSWWLQGGRFVTNIASEAAMLLLAHGRLDGLAIMGYDACHRPYQKLWFHLLDTGAVVPGFAEVDLPLDAPRTFAAEKTFVNYLHIPGKISLQGIVSAARRGACFMSTGAFLTASIDGVPMGQAAVTSRGRLHRLRVEAYPPPNQARFSRIAILGPGGRLLARQDGFPGGVLEYELSGRDRPHYVVVQAFGENDDPDAPSQKAIAHLAMTNPVYLHPSGFRFRPVTTDYTVEVRETSPWIGGVLEFQHSGGEPIRRHAIRTGTIHAQLPAGARVELRKPGMPVRRFYIAMENPAVQRLLRYLYAGEFRKDFPQAAPGDVPPAAFHLKEMRQALSRAVYVLM